MKRMIPEFFLAAFALLIVQCSAEREKKEDWRQIVESEMSEKQTSQVTRMLSARDTLVTRLSHKLRSAMKESGPAVAISVCKIAAPEVAEEISSQQGLSIGRTSFRLRNPENQAPDWAIEYIDRRVEEPVYLERGDAQTAALLPIRMGAVCTICHGSPDEIPTGVVEALRAGYPDDQATGFAAGDLRGWFWIETTD